MKLLVATQNQGKVREFSDMLTELQVEWVGLKDLGITMDVDETGTTFTENAILKARTYANVTGLLTLADDSGLEVAHLDGAPGLYTARYGGPGLSHGDRYRLLLENLKDVPMAERVAQFRCVIAVSNKAGEILLTSEGICGGYIAEAPRGTHGFGYDPVFLPDAYPGQTMAELTPHEKHPISHRGQAIANMKQSLLSLVAP